MITQKEIEFIQQNATADTNRLLLGASKFADIDVKLCVNCIEARKKLASKLPSWYANHELAYPFPLSAEQCSSQQTAEYKKELIAQLLQKTKKAADLTGGMGVDSFYLSQLADEFHYFERNEELCHATEYNFGKLGAQNVMFHNYEINPQNITEILEKPLDFIFIDPARRSKTDKATKVISLQDYEPNILELKQILFNYTKYILVKVSPMADIKLNLELLPETSAIHVVSVDNECKELLFLLEAPKPKVQKPNASKQNITITTVNISTKKNKISVVESQNNENTQKYCFTFQEEEQAEAVFTSTVQQYLYEPNKSLLKAGAFKSLSGRYKVEKLAPSTHLYTSKELVTDFPGKIFKVDQVVDFNKKTIKNLAKEYPHADLSARNFPLNTNELKKLSGIKDGGNHHIFAVTLTDGSRKIIITSIS